MSKKKNKRKRQKKIALPTDRNGTPINIGDWVMFDERPVHVMSLTIYSDGGWSIGDEENDYAADNLGGGVVLGMR